MSERKRPVLARTAARRAAAFSSEKQAIDIVVLDLRNITDFADYFVICSGVVDVHVKAIYDHVDSEMRKIGWKPRNIEGTDTLKWILIDYIDVVIHIFQPDARGYYAVERLWGDAPKVNVKGVTD